jgi:hypothetical protein
MRKNGTGRKDSGVQCCTSEMFIPDPNFSIPDTGSKRFRIPDPQQKISVFLTLKALGEMIWNVHTGSGFFPIPDTKSGSATLVVLV